MKSGEVVVFKNARAIYRHFHQGFFRVVEDFGITCTIQALDGRVTYTRQYASTLRRATPLELLALEAE